MSRLQTLIVAGLMMLVVTLAARAEDLRPSWQCLPQQTLVVVRVPQPKQMLEQLRATTKLGKVMLSTDRLEQYRQLFEQSSPDKWKEMTDDLAKVGLTPDDLPHYLEGEFGFALIGEKRDGPTPLMVGVVWLNCGEERADKMVELIKQKVADAADENPEYPTKRVDMELEGQPVLLLSEPQIEPDWETYSKEVNERIKQHGADVEGNALPARPQQDQQGPVGTTEQDNDWPELKMIHADQQNTMITRMGGRVLIAFSITNNTEAYHKQVKAGTAVEQINFDELSGLQQMSGIFARFIAAHHGGDTDYAAHLLSTPGLTAAMPDGVPMLEVYGDLRPLWTMLDEEKLAEAKPILQMLGVDQLSTGAIKLTLDGNVLCGGGFIAAPTPRVGVMAMLDQQEVAPEPAAWVPAHVMQYQRVSFDLGKVYAQVREMVIKQYGDAAKQTFDKIDMQVKTMSQVDMATLLGAMGSQIYALSYEPRTAGKAADELHPGDLQRMALVWQLTDEQVWQRMLTSAAGMGAMFFGDKIQQVEEQGFKGWRLDADETELAFMLGKGYLVVTIGYGVGDQLLNVLGNPPQGADALAGSEVMSRARALLDLAPNIVFTVTNGDMYLQAMLPMIIEGAMKEIEASNDQADKELAAKVRQALPSRDEMKGLIGVSVNQTRMNDQGMVMQSAAELPQ